MSHNWVEMKAKREVNYSVCLECGITQTSKNKKTDCPPWGITKKEHVENLLEVMQEMEEKLSYLRDANPSFKRFFELLGQMQETLKSWNEK
jgi:hypothetical protein